MRGHLTLVTAILFGLGITGDALAADTEALPAWTIGPGQTKIQAQVVGLKQGQLTFRDAANKEQIVALDTLPAGERKDALVRVVGSGVVVVHAKDVVDQPIGLGSGFFFQKDGLILTNYHVVRGAGSLEIETRDNDAKLKADLLAVDRLNDIAILKVEKLPAGTHILELSVREVPKPGDTVWTIGHPQELKNTVSWGDVNAVRKSKQLNFPIPAPAETQWIQTDAVIDQGSSGGPLLNPQGQAVAMNTYRTAPQMAFALHLSHVRPVFETARTAKPLELPLRPSDGESAFDWLSREVGPTVHGLVTDIQKLRQEAVGMPRQQAVERLRAINAQYREKLLGIANAHPADWPGLQAMLYLCDLAAADSPEGMKCVEEICKHLTDHHLQSAHLGPILAKLNSRGEPCCLAVVEQSLAKSPHAPIKAQAAVGMAIQKLQWVAFEGGLDLEKTKAAREGAAALIARLEKEFAEVPLGEFTGNQYGAQLKVQLATLRPGLPADEITGVDAAGKEFKLSEYKGKVVLLDFFADWCPHCKRMYPSEQNMVKELKDRKFALLGVNTENQRVLSGLVENKTVTWRTWADGEGGPIAAAWGVNSYPNLYLLDHNGIIRRHYAGVPAEDELAKAIDTLLKEADAAK
jgi:S1-C subfamily serine protease/thiol-disulfide isomerase/thioredoxin